jgi:hypothetical protein
MIIEITSAGPAFCDAAVPVRTKIPVPMIDPIPRVVRFSGPSARRRVLLSASARRVAWDFLVKRLMTYHRAAEVVMPSLDCQSPVNTAIRLMANG